MKKSIIIICVLIKGVLLFAQDCIPNPANYSKRIINALQYKTKDSLAKDIITWNDVAPIYDSILADTTGMKKGDIPPSKEKAKEDIDIKLVKELNKNLDSLLLWGSRFGIDWKNILYKNDASRITKEKDLPASLWFNDGKVQFDYGDSLYELNYQALLINNEWKMAGINPGIGLYDKKGKSLGEISSVYEDFSNPTAEVVDSSKIAADSAVAMMQPIKPTKKQTIPVKKKKTITKQAIKKPDTN